MTQNLRVLFITLTVCLTALSAVALHALPGPMTLVGSIAVAVPVTGAFIGASILVRARKLRLLRRRVFIAGSGLGTPVVVIGASLLVYQQNMLRELSYISLVATLSATSAIALSVVVVRLAEFNLDSGSGEDE